MLIINSVVMQTCSIAPGLFAAPGRRHCLPPGKAEGVKRHKAPVRNAAPRGPPCGRAGPLRDRRPITRTGAPCGASPRRFRAEPVGCRTDLGPRLRTGVDLAVRFGRPAGSLHTDRSVRRAGPRGLPRVRPAKPDPQAPPLLLPNGATGWRPSTSRVWEYNRTYILDLAGIDA